MWFATYDGLVRYDGVRLTIFDKGNSEGISSNRLLVLTEDNEGSLWVGTVDGGMFRYHQGKFKYFSTEQGLWSFIGRIHITKDGLPLVYTGDGKHGVWSKQNTLLETDPRLLREFVDRSNSRWVFDNGDVVRFKDGQEKRFSLKLKEEEFSRFHYEDREGNMWFSKLADGLYQIVGEKVIHFTKEIEQMPDNYLRFGGEDGEGNLWIYSEHNFYRFKDGVFTRYSSMEYLNSKNLRTIFCDREGTIWIGTDERGVFRLTKKFLTTYTENEGLLNNNIYPIFEDSEGKIWLGTNQSGMTSYTAGKFTVFPLTRPRRDLKQKTELTRVDDKRPKVNVQSFYQEKNGRMWIGIGGGLITFEKGKVTDVSELIEGSADVIYKDREENLWFGTEKGLFKKSKSDGKIKGYKMSDGLPNNAITVIREDRQYRVWIGTRDGFARREGERFIPITTKDGLVGNRIRSLYEDSEGVLWIGTFDSGLSRYKDGKFTNYTVKEGLFNNGVFVILEDNHGNFWMSSNRGIYRVSKKQLNDFAEGKIRKINSVAYGNEDGMLSTECNGGRQPAGVKARDGKLWFPTQSGAVVIDPEIVPYNSQAPLPIIETVVIDRDKVGFENSIEIEPYQTDLEISYTAPSSMKAEFIHFKYKLDGLNADWIEAGTRRTVHYSHLPPGNYTFRVIAANSDGVWSESGTTLKVNMKPYFYQTNAFLVVCVFVALASGLIIYSLRVRRLKTNERRLTLLVYERTAELVERTEELEVANDKLEKLATLDGLTNISNRRRFEDFLEQEWHRAQRQKAQLSLLLMDVDFFKLYNDTYGHQGGDDCLKQVAAVLSDTVKRTTDLAARYGGEEFVVILTDTDKEGASVVAETIRSRVEALKIPHRGSKVNEFVTVSVGVATVVPKPSEHKEHLILNADNSLYRAKENGRNRCWMAEELSVAEMQA